MTLTLGLASQFLPGKSKSCFHHSLAPGRSTRSTGAVRLAAAALRGGCDRRESVRVFVWCV